MKPFYCIDTSTDNRNNIMNAPEQLKSKITSQSSLAPAKVIQRKIDQLVTQKELPIYAQLLLIFILFAGAGAFVLMLYNVESNGNLYKSIGLTYPFTLAPIFLFLFSITFFIVFSIYFSQKQKKILKSKEYKKLSAEKETEIKRIYNELEVPESSVNTDIIFFHYKNGNDRIKIVNNKCCYTCAFKCYREDNCFYMADIYSKYKFDINKFSSLKTINSSIYLTPQNIDRLLEAKNKKVGKIRYSRKHFKYKTSPYYVIEYKCPDESWCIYFPCYELETIEKLTGLKAEDI